MNKTYFIPFTRMAIIRFKRGKILNVRFDNFIKKLGIWSLTIGRFMLINDYIKAAIYFEVFSKEQNLEVSDTTELQSRHER